MNQFLCLTPEQFDRIETLNFAPGCPKPYIKELRNEKAEAHFLQLKDEIVQIRCSIWTQDTWCLKGRKSGYIGHFEACDSESANDFLPRVLDFLKQSGIQTAIGPINGNTWSRYRFATDGFEKVPFFMEPWNPHFYPTLFQSSGFTTLAEYQSCLVENLESSFSRLDSCESIMKKNEIQVRNIDLEHYEEEITKIYQLSCKAFKNNLLYRPVDLTFFLQKYKKFKPYIDPGFVLLAERNEAFLGFMFSIPDLKEVQQTGRAETLIVKTSAIEEGRSQAGLGVYFLELSHKRAYENGYQKVIHALQHTDNPVTNTSRKYGNPMRKYSMFSKQL